ncbi:MAG: hypothetical protein BWK77_07175 [Verrucomicrobia bacterium A1]|nr:MAG: hypothetical protein BWK77_07175 [Verrucomicrobia bacterium A1]
MQSVQTPVSARDSSAAAIATGPPAGAEMGIVAAGAAQAWSARPAAARTALRIAPPDILIRVGLRDIPVLDFGRTDDVLRRGRTAAAGLRRTLEQTMMGTARLQRRAALGASDGRRCWAGSV